jgi:CRP-like cAMP-binding protein
VGECDEQSIDNHSRTMELSARADTVAHAVAGEYAMTRGATRQTSVFDVSAGGAAAGGAAARAPRAGARQHSSWSKARLSAAVAATRPGRGRAAIDQPLGDEIEFFAAVGTRHEVPSGVALVRRGRAMDEVCLVQRGAVAVIGEHSGRRPILSFAVRSEFCCAVPALLREPAPWDAITVVGSSVITVPTAHFTAAVRERWVDRWSTRTLSWLAEIGARTADLDEGDLTGQTAALLLRHHGELSVDLCSRTIADLLDVDDEAIRPILRELERRGAVRVAGGRVSIAQPEILQTTVAAARQGPRHAAGHRMRGAAVSDRDRP